MVINYGILTILIVFLFFVPKFLKDLKKREYDKIILRILFFIYFINLLKFAIFPIFINSKIAIEIQKDFTPLHSLIKNLEITPFKNIALTEFLLNILLTFPLGCFLPVFYSNLSKKKILFFSVLTGFTIESIQAILVFVQGFTFRTISINDLIANSIGVFLGYLFFVFCFRTFMMIYETKNNLIPKPILYLSKNIILNNKHLIKQKGELI